MAIEADFAAEEREHLEDRLMVHLSLSVLVNFSEDVFEEFIVDFGEDMMLAYVICS